MITTYLPVQMEAYNLSVMSVGTIIRLSFYNIVYLIPGTLSNKLVYKVDKSITVINLQDVIVLCTPLRCQQNEQN